VRVLAIPSLLSALVLSWGVAAEDSVAAGVKVVSDKNPDLSSVENVLKTILKPGMKDQEKCEAIYDFLVRHSYHHMPPEEPCADTLRSRPVNGENSKVMDATKLLNVYGYAICGSIAPVENFYFNAAGLLGRVCGATGHTVCEVKYDDKWHHFDVDMMGYCRRKEDGTVPSVDDIAANKSLILERHDKQPKDYYKYDKPEGEFAALKNGIKFAMYGRKVNAHSMNLTLREGETLARFFKRQWAPKYQFGVPVNTDSEYRNTLLKMRKEGPCRPETWYMFKEAGEARYGNFELTYEPPLRKKSCLDGIFQKTNVQHRETAPFLSSENAANPSEVVYHYYSPYGCAGCPNNLADPKDDSDGAKFEGEFANDKGTIALSLDLGKSWTVVHDKGGKFALDLTQQLQFQYDWMIKLSFQGEGSGLSAFKSKVRGMVSPMSLPYVDGETKMTYTREETDCLLYAPDITLSKEELERTAFKVERVAAFAESGAGHYTFAQNDGAVIFKVDAPGDITRVQTGARFSGRNKSTRFGVAFSIDEGATWVTAGEQGIIADEPKPEEHWMQCIDGVLDFEGKKAFSFGALPVKGSIRSSDFEPKPAKSVLVKIYTKGGNGVLINLFGIYVHYKKPGALPLTITHKWTGGQHEEKIGAGEKSKTYTVKGGPLAANESITISAGEK
jgi:hypothetical protein